jgi:hypothetical protein
MIAKIYGIYEFLDLGEEPIIMVLMRDIRGNFAEILRNNLRTLRTYDLKGSTIDRQII